MSAPWKSVAASVAPVPLAVGVVAGAAYAYPMAWWGWAVACVWAARIFYQCAERLEEVCSKHDDPIY